MLERIKRYQLISFLGIIPIILLFPIIDWTFKYRDSISDYAYSSIQSLFVMILTLAASILFVNGCEDDVHTKNKWYSFIQGFLLLGIALTPHKDYTIIHFACAGTFFIGNMIEMTLLSSPRYRYITFPLAITILIGLIGHFIYKCYSMFWGEIIGLLPFVINRYLEINNKID